MHLLGVRRPPVLRKQLVKMSFYDGDSVERELGPYGLVDQCEIDEPAPSGGTLPFINVVCKKG